MERSDEISRRSVIVSAALVPVSAIAAAAQPSTAQQVESALSASQLKVLEAIVDRLIPKDELGAGALECGAATYIDRSLAGFLAPEKPAFVEGLNALDEFARTHGGPFAELAPAKQDEVLTAIENDTRLVNFFSRVRRLTLEGMFGDPYYGGNRNFAGWDLIRYPGPRIAVGPEEQKMSVTIKPYRKSAYGGSDGH